LAFARFTSGKLTPNLKDLNLKLLNIYCLPT